MIGTAPRQAKVPLVDDIKEKTIVYGLFRRWDNQLCVFNYILRACLPVSRETVDIKLDKEKGMLLGSYWKQNEYGTFLGRHSMDWIVRHLNAGLEI